jgi:glutamate racemase
VSNNAPIGVFDSGIGGLTVVKEIIKLMPNENIVYFGDTGRAPYGSRPVEQIIEFSKQILDFLNRQGIKIAVVACNTMTMWALEQACSRYSFPIVGTNSGEQLALAATKNKNIGIAATQATINSGKHAKRIKAADASARVFPQACPPLVPLVEREELTGAAAEAACRECFQPMKDAGVDTVVLGCTHYPFLLETINHILRPNVTIIDPAEQTARDAYETLKSMDLLANAGQQAIRRFCFSADPARAKRLAQRIINVPLPDFQQVDILK